MANEPITIENFTGIKDDGFYWMEGFTPRKQGGKSFLHTGASTSATFVEGDTNLTNLGLTLGITASSHVASGRIYTIDNAGYLYRTDTGGNNLAQLKDLSSIAGTPTDSYSPDVAPFTISGTKYLIFTTATHLFGTANDTAFDTIDQAFSTSTAATTIRQLHVWEDTLYCGNLTTLASLSDTGTFTDAAKNLPNGYNFQCMAHNNNFLLVGMNRESKGQLGLWDGFSDGWNYLKILSDEVYALKEYKTGWIVLAGQSIYFTNGQSLSKLADLPDSEYTNQELKTLSNGIEIIGDKIFFTTTQNYFTRQKAGIWIYDIKGDYFLYTPCANNSSSYAYAGITGGAIYKEPINEKIFVGYSVGVIANNNFVSTLFLNTSSDNSEFITPAISIGKRALLKSVIIEFLPEPENLTRYDSPSLTLTLKIANGLELLWDKVETDAASSAANQIEIDGSFPNNSNFAVGLEVMPLEGVNAGERREISSIANDGQATEQWTVGTAFSNNCEDNLFLQVTPFTTLDSAKTFSDYTENRAYFDCGNHLIYGTFFLKLHASHTNFPPIITSITINYQELSDPK